ncbi:MAG: hypothetical protein H7246_15765 [Phycisphaerae bacterium]|nr:hypothetical protein [Saprospiraceae bacterium]
MLLNGIIVANITKILTLNCQNKPQERVRNIKAVTVTLLQTRAPKVRSSGSFPILSAIFGAEGLGMTLDEWTMRPLFLPIINGQIAFRDFCRVI